MRPEQMIIATLSTILGLLYCGAPRLLLNFRAWWMKRTIGAEFIPSKRTEWAYRLFGAILLLFGMTLFVRSLF